MQQMIKEIGKMWDQDAEIKGIAHFFSVWCFPKEYHLIGFSLPSSSWWSRPRVQQSKSSAVPVESAPRIVQLWENCWAHSFRCNVHHNPADILVVREMIGVGILGACSLKSSVTSRLISMLQESTVTFQRDRVPGRRPCCFSPVSWALVVHMPQL